MAKKIAKKASPKTSQKTAKKTAKTTAPKAAAKAANKSPVAYKLNEGDTVPAFNGASTSHQTIGHGSNKKYVLYFYPKDNTPGCTLEGQDFRRLYKDFQKVAVAIIGVSHDSVASHEKFKAKCDFPFDLLSDEDGSICKAFDVIQMKSMYGRDFEGIERSTFLIAGGKIRKAWRKVRVDGHVQEVLDSAQSL